MVQCPSLVHPRTIKQTPTNFEFILGLLMNRTSVQINALSQMLSRQTDAEPQLMKQLQGKCNLYNSLAFQRHVVGYQATAQTPKRSVQQVQFKVGRRKLDVQLKSNADVQLNKLIPIDQKYISDLKYDPRLFEKTNLDSKQFEDFKQ